MVAALWRIIARIVSRPAVADYIIRRAQRTPYFHLEGYMERWWLFNGTPPLSGGKGRRFEWLPSIRVHHILRADHDRHPHNHPWNARTIILRGFYLEKRDDGTHLRMRGDTATLKANDFHRILSVPADGVWTLFISWRWRHVWGFRQDDGSVTPWQEYLAPVRYVLRPGSVVSRSDGQEHYISATSLRQLYRVPRDADVIVDDGKRPFRPRHRDVILRPRNDGDYTLPTS